MHSVFRQIPNPCRPEILIAALCWCAATTALAQNSSLFRQETLAARAAAQGGTMSGPAPLTLANSSWLYEGVDPPRVFKLNDLITVMVVETSQVSSNNKIQRRKQGQLDATLSNFVKFKGLELVPTVGGQQINGTLQGQFQAQSNLDTKDLMQFSIEVRIVDIRPNGHLVVEGHQTMINNEERWRRRVSGIVRPEDVLPNNSVLSEKVAELSIDKREEGMARDGYRRGWAFYLLDRFGMF
jgi:flagellar L-ring protein precursor FlgH